MVVWRQALLREPSLARPLCAPFSSSRALSWPGPLWAALAPPWRLARLVHSRPGASALLLGSPEPAPAHTGGWGQLPPVPRPRLSRLARGCAHPQPPQGPGAPWPAALSAEAAAAGPCGRSCPVLCSAAAVARWCPQCEDADHGQPLLGRAPAPHPSGLHRSLLSSRRFVLGSFSFPPAPSRLSVGDPRLCDPQSPWCCPTSAPMFTHAPSPCAPPGGTGRPGGAGGVLASAPRLLRS